MKKHLAHIIVLLFLPLLSVAQNAISETYVIQTDSIGEIQLAPKYWRVWDDSSGKTNFKTVVQNAFQSRFRQFDTAQQFDFSVKTFWYKIRLKNALQRETEIGIPAEAQMTDIYYLNSALKWKHLQTGWGYHKSERDGYKYLNTASILLQPQEEVVLFIRRHNSFRFSIPKTQPVLIMQTHLRNKFDLKNNFSGVSYFEYTVTAFLLGLILIAFVFNLIFYKAVKENEYLYFSLFLLFFGISYVMTTFSDLLFGSYGFWNLLVRNIMFAVWFFVLVLFIRAFFRTKYYLPKWDKFLYFFNYIVAAAWLFEFYLFQAKMTTYWFDRLIDGNSLLYYLQMDFLFITVLLLVFNKKVKINFRLLSTLPLFFLFGPIYSLTELFFLREKYFNVKPPAFQEWVLYWNSLLTLIGVLWMILFFSWLLFKRYQTIQEKLTQEVIDRERIEKEKEAEKNLLISQQNERLEEEVKQRTKELQHTIEDLKATQTQLVQAEKMASLGELTAGIAHEIQNPLNFVNNFSDTNKELLEELREEMDKGNLDEAKAIAADLLNNSEKINHHGKRADAIVKNMLQHSRSGSGQKELADINALCDEYLRLSYHGLRAKDKSFNADFKKAFDVNIPKLNVIPQDIGRVLLNLLNNAFYAVNEKKKSLGNEYQPLVELRTEQRSDSVIISVKDNGTGIPEKALNKIFQPFFTTKPTGEGTGLGLSLSYDIITKGHSGKMNVITKENEGTEFIIQLPV